MPGARAANADVGFRGVLRIRAFRKLWIALSLSSFGDWLGFLAQTSLAQSLQGGDSTYLKKNFAIGVVVFVRLLPAVTLAPIAGAFADRFDRRKTMVVSDFMRMSLYVSIPLVHTLWWLFAATFLIETVTLFWLPAKEATVPNLVPRERLEQANQLSLVTTYGSAPVAAGVFALLALLAGLLRPALHFFTKGHIVYLALYFDAITFLVSALTIYSLREIPSPRLVADPAPTSAVLPTGSAVDGTSLDAVTDAATVTATDTAVATDPLASADLAASRQSVFRQIAEGWRFIGQTPLTRGLVLGLVGAFAAAGVVVGLGRTYVGDLGGGDPGYGALFGSVFVGLAAGMFLGPKLLASLSRRRLFGASITSAGICLALTAIVHNLVLVVFGVAFMGAFAGIAWVTGYTLFGLEVEDSKRGRTWSTLQSLIQIDLLVMVAAGPFISGAIGVHTLHIKAVVLRENGSSFTLLGAGVIAVLAGVFAYQQLDDRDVALWHDVAAAVRGVHPLTGRGVPTGLFVAFEGGDGAGKSTQARLLAEALTERGYEVVATREPGATPLGRRIRELLLDPAQPPVSPRAEALLYAADRADHVIAVIRPALARGAVVISDRYVDSSLAYQGGGRHLSSGEVERLSRFATEGLKPDLTVLLDVGVDEGLDRASARSAVPDKLEAESDAFHERVRATFRALAAANPDRYLVLDAALPIEVIRERVERRVASVLPRAHERAAPRLRMARR